MIAVDTSALMAVLLGEAQADECTSVLESAGSLLISSGTLAEALIVAARRNLGVEMAMLIDGLGFEIANVTPAAARRIALAYETWGRGLHPAGLNFGDCFAYEVAKENACPLLYVGEDFSRTDIESAL
ncbi:type II toxin-antitoxin system VapC family toxin [Hyphomonas sp.]|uniref:type II toxin-antitoxin system VapC family toxin n=1 Tax=Hyphomonas sp. TaxID=87 RepID=UPI00333E7FF5